MRNVAVYAMTDATVSWLVTIVSQYCDEVCVVGQMFLAVEL